MRTQSASDRAPTERLRRLEASLDAVLDRWHARTDVGGPLLGVMACAGGCGSSTLAVNLAVERVAQPGESPLKSSTLLSFEPSYVTILDVLPIGPGVIQFYIGLDGRILYVDKQVSPATQGKTIADALHSLGYGGVEDVRQGKYFELDLATKEAAQAKKLAAEVADKLLANPVIESYRIEVEQP